jgi:cell shape-determining protein MreC
LIGLTVFVILILLHLFFASFFSSLSVRAAEPLWQLRDNLFGQNKNMLTAITDTKSSLQNQVSTLQAEVYDLQIKNTELSATALSGTHPDAVSFANTNPNTTGTTLITAKVISKPPFAPFDTFILDQGSLSGIKIGDDVFIGKNILIGTISEVQDSFSHVTLFSSGTESRQINILRTGQTVSFNGRGGGNFNASLPKDLDVVVGDYLVDTSSKQHIIAQVYYIDTSSGGSFKEVFARIPINILEASWVSVSI